MNRPALLYNPEAITLPCRLFGSHGRNPMLRVWSAVALAFLVAADPAAAYRPTDFLGKWSTADGSMIFDIEYPTPYRGRNTWVNGYIGYLMVRYTCAPCKEKKGEWFLRIDTPDGSGDHYRLHSKKNEVVFEFDTRDTLRLHGSIIKGAVRFDRVR